MYLLQYVILLYSITLYYFNKWNIIIIIIINMYYYNIGYYCTPLPCTTLRNEI